MSSSVDRYVVGNISGGVGGQLGLMIQKQSWVLFKRSGSNPQENF